MVLRESKSKHAIEIINWLKISNLIGGWDRIDLNRAREFDYLVCVSFDKDMLNRRFFIFTKTETSSFPLVRWSKGKELG